ncbi:MAG: HD domain-containing phosphohydrolase [Spirochaetota bacterium]
MRIIKVSELQVGSKFSKPVFLDADNMFLNADTPVTDADIRRLKKFGFKEVMTHGEVVTKSSPIPDETPIELEPLDFSANFDDDNAVLKQNYDSKIKRMPDFLTVYRNSFDILRDFYRQIADKKQPDISPIRKVSEDIIELLKKLGNISFYLLQHETDGYYLYNHVLYASFYAIFLGMQMKFNRPKLIDLGSGALLADIGMAKIPHDISDKTESLRPDEVALIKKHTLVGFHILTGLLKFKKNIAMLALQHHENFDGSGYPQKLKSGTIDELSRVYTIADHFSALVLDRPWRKKKLPYEALRSMISGNMNKFDVRYMKIFIACVSMYPVGSYVELSNNSLGMVVESNPKKPLRPVVLLVKDSSGRQFPQANRFVDLAKEDVLSVTKAITYS